MRDAGLVDEPADRGRGTARLRGEPVPVAREERDLAADDTEARAAGAAVRVCGVAGVGPAWRRVESEYPGEELHWRAAQIEVDRLAGDRVEDDRSAIEARGLGGLRREGDVGELAGGDESWAGERDSESCVHRADITTVILRCQY